MELELLRVDMELEPLRADTTCPSTRRWATVEDMASRATANKEYMELLFKNIEHVVT